MSSFNKQKGIKRELSYDDESKSTVQSGTASSYLYQPVKQEQLYESESKSIHQLEATFSFAGPVKQENVQVKQDETSEPVSYVFGHMAKCTLGNQCTTPNCSSIKAMAKHWLSCASAHCSICAPFQPQSNNPLPVCGQPTPGTETNVPSPNVSQSNVAQPLVSNLQSFSSQSTHTQALRQLLSTLRNNNNPETRQQVLNVLKSQPALMATFIKQRQETQRQQQQRYFQSYINQSHNSLPQTSRQIISCPQTNVPTKLNEPFSNYNYNNLGRQVAQLKHQHN